MKTIIILLTWVSIPAFAVQNWYPVGKEGANTVYSKASKCKAVEGQDCMDVTGIDRRYHDVVNVEVDDYQKPLYTSKSKVVACDDASDCAVKTAPYTQDWNKPLGERYCNADLRDHLQYGPNNLMPGYSYWCWRQSGWEQKTIKELQLNAATKATIEAADAASVIKEAGISQAMRKMSQGKRVLAIVAVRNAAKGLSKGQIKQMHQTYALVKDMLDAGSLGAAKDEVLAITPDATIVTQDDKDAILAELDSLIAQ